MLVSVGGATQYRSRLKFYGVTSAQRVPAIADVPTLTEQGVPMVGGFWMGVLAPPNTPPAAVGALSKAIEEVTSSSQYQAKLVEFGMAALPGTQAEFSRYYLDEYRKWGELVKAANVKIE
jgi:tripartite-type tricarboxylate transporter receptor subunit TctC